MTMSSACLGTIGQQAKQGPVPIGTDSLSFQTLAWPHRELSSSEAGGIIQEKAGREHPVLRERVSEVGASIAPRQGSALARGWWTMVWTLSNIASAGSQSRPQTHPEGGHYWGLGRKTPVLMGLSVGSGNLPATLTMIHGQQRPEHVMGATAAVSG